MSIFPASLFGIMASLALYLFPSLSFAAEDVSSLYVRRSQTKADNVIIFVHGVLGNGETTWGTAPNSWPLMLTTDQDFNGADIFVYSYPTSMWATLSIDELAENMRLQLKANRVSDYQRLVFLVHSMGGLVTRDYLLKNRDAAARTRFIYFLSTPTTGSQVALLATLLSRTPQLDKMKPMNAEDFLADQLRQWLAADFKIPSYCAYERQPTDGLLIVPLQSASALCNKAIDPINANHIEISKPPRKSADAYLAFKVAYNTEMTAVRPSNQLITQFQHVLNALHETQMRKNEDLFPQLQAYISEPSEANWRRVRDTANALNDEIRSAVNASIAFDSQFYEQGNTVIMIANGGNEVVNRAFNQSFLVPRQEWNGLTFITKQVIQVENRPTVDQVREWATQLRNNYNRLEAEMNRLLTLIQQRNVRALRLVAVDVSSVLSCR
ncbi:hypothetical protein [Bradyrhizobium sp. RT7b]|uniref:esterase/lipase family protein n=1 Tax=unclassified Bradyrhizobium TaxID=2631580 RepID=UPI003393B0C2